MLWDRVSVPIGIQVSLDNIFAALLLGGIDTNNNENQALIERKRISSRDCFAEFIASFPFNIFNNNYAIFYEIFSGLRIRSFTPDQLQSILETNSDLVLDSPYIDKSAYSETENGNIANSDDILSAITDNLIDSMNELSCKEVSVEEFKSACITYIGWYKNAFGEYTALNMSAIMNLGYEEKKPNKKTKIYKGLDDMQAYYNENMRIIKALSEKNGIANHTIDAEWFENEIRNENKADTSALMSLGIPEMDETIGELHRGNMLGIMGPPKGGKTRFTAYVVMRALLLGLNVCVWPVEGTKEEWMAMLEACYIASVSYNNKKSTDGMVRISSKDILDRRYSKSNELRKYVIAAKKVIATSPNCGRLSFITGTPYVEDMFDVMQAHYDNDNKFDILVIDQLVNVQSKTGKGKVERISEAYMQTKNFIANTLKVPAIGLMPAQLKQEVVDFLRKNPEETIDVTSGGESSETIRTPDEVIGLFSSKEERKNNIMKFYSVASRHNESFDDFQGKCYMECCYFLSNTEQET